MALLRISEAKKLSPTERITKLAEINLELIKAGVTAHKATAKTKELKRARARLLTLTHQAERAKA
jgi:ribosomal protein L29